MNKVEGRQKGPGAAILDSLFAVDPFYWTSFYKKARFFQLEPRPEPPQVILDITKDCPFECSFCFASGTIGTGRRIGLVELEELERSLRGLDRVILLGGEPLVHPDLDRVLAMLADNHAEIEVFTNGRTLPSREDARSRWVADRFGHLPADVTLTLAVDRFHREQYGYREFAAKVDAFLDMVDEGVVKVRFNVTAEGLYSAGYLQVRDAEACLEELHRGLSAAFRGSMEDGTAEEVFQFSPVIRMGRASDAPGEYLKAAEALFAPEVVVTPDADGGLSVLNFLPASWMPVVPDPVRLGRVGRTSLEDILLEKVVGRRLDFDAFPEAREAFGFFHASRSGRALEARDLQERALSVLAGVSDAPAKALEGAIESGAADAIGRILRIYPAWRRLHSWPTDRDEYPGKTADGLYSLCRKAGQGFDLHSDHKIRRVTTPMIRLFLSRYLAVNAEAASALVEHLAGHVTVAVASGGFPAFVGFRPRPGLITDAPDAPIPLQDVDLDLGLENPYYGDALVRPRVVVRAVVDGQGLVRVEFDGVGTAGLSPQKGIKDAIAAFARILGFAGYLLPQGLLPDLRRRVDDRLNDLAEGYSGRGDDRLAELARGCRGVEPRIPRDSADETPGLVFRLLVREQEAHLKSDPAVLALLKGDPLPAWPDELVEGFRLMLDQWASVGSGRPSD
ncbi:MAG: radical SAM protein [Deltaproteobacteria bacterium]|nr:radical SAM protein [Deltaproteobacteria bacterium]